MIQIRNNVFETNSSSAHTIAIKKKGEYDYNLGWLVDDDGVMDLSYFDYYYGRSPFKILSKTEDKLPYFICSFGYEVMKRIILNSCPNVKKIIKKKDLSKWDDPDMKDGIDHQSIGMLEQFIFKHNLSIEEVLFNNKYIIIVDGDEYLIWYDMVKDGIVNKEDYDDTGTDTDF